jgi:hypothetical protein
LPSVLVEVCQVQIKMELWGRWHRHDLHERFLMWRSA